MGKSRGRRIAYAFLGVALVLVAAPAIGATSPGSIRITEPVATTADGGTVSIEWSYRPGTEIKSTSKVNVYWTLNGVVWSRIASGVPIRSGGVDWDSAGINAPVALQTRVIGTSIRATVSPVLIDNTKPTVDIVRPSNNQVIVDDTAPNFAVVAGSATVVADARDSLSGIKEVRWLLDGTQIGTGASFEYDFGSAPGQHVLTAVAVDHADNTAEDATEILALPGPSNLGEVPEVPTLPEQPTVPEDPTLPDPDGDPTLPEVPEVPSPDPSTLPNPDPSQTPTPPDPTELIPDDLPTP